MSVMIGNTCKSADKRKNDKPFAGKLMLFKKQGKSWEGCTLHRWSFKKSI